MEIPESSGNPLVSPEEEADPTFQIIDQGDNWIRFTHNPEEDLREQIDRITHPRNPSIITHERNMLTALDNPEHNESTIININNEIPLRYDLEKDEEDTHITAQVGDDAKYPNQPTINVVYKNGEPTTIRHRSIAGKEHQIFHFKEKDSTQTTQDPSEADEDNTDLSIHESNGNIIVKIVGTDQHTTFTIPAQVNIDEIIGIITSSNPSTPDLRDANFEWMKITELLPVSISKQYR